MIKGKKASARDIIVFVAVLFALGVGFFIINFILNLSVDELLSHEEINQTDEVVDALNSMDKLTNRLDYLFFGIFIALVLGIIITGWFIGGVPIFMIAYFMVMLVSIPVGAGLSNGWEMITDDPTLAASIVSFPITNHILDNLPLYAVVVGFIGIVVMFGKPYVAGGNP